VLVATTTRPDHIDEAMMRPGRLDTLMFIDRPTPDDRLKLMHGYLEQSGMDQDGVDWSFIVKSTSGWACSDLAMFIRYVYLSFAYFD
jgi:SpoVK/Ycf46/Vps4 family AAA+-type ATPase